MRLLTGAIIGAGKRLRDSRAGGWIGLVASRLVIYTDACISKDSTLAGLGAVVYCDSDVQRLGQVAPATNNNQAELLAVLMALDTLEPGDSALVHTDSRYVSRGCNRFLAKWRKNGWVGLRGKPIQHQDEWERMIDLKRRFNVQVKWVPSHNPDYWGNREAHQLAAVALWNAETTNGSCI